MQGNKPIVKLLSWWQKRRKPLLGVAITLLIVGVLVLVTFGYLLRWNWTGFSTKTLWDWMQLFIIPVVLAIGGFLFSQVQKNNEQKIATDNQQEAALQLYIDKISELLLKEHLRESPNEEVQDLARVRTLTVLPRLDAYRKRRVLRFLYESGLIGKGNDNIIDLGGANLRGADLHEAYLYGANLSIADLRGADLRGADLREVDLRGAKMNDETDLRGTKLRGAEYNTKGIEQQMIRHRREKVATIEPTQWPQNFRAAEAICVDCASVQ